MKILFLSDSAKRNSAYCVSGHKLLAGVVVTVLFVPIALGVASYWIVASIDRTLNPFVDPEYRIAVEARVNQQQDQIVKTRKFVRQHMDVLGQQVGRLQAQVSRINAVEQRIADSAGIDLSDFQFDRDPPIGGTDSAADMDSEEIDIENAIIAIEQELALRESELTAVDLLLNRNNLKRRQTPAGWPVRNGWVSSSFGTRLHPLTGKKQFHRGVDIPGKPGAEVLAVADGVVIRAEKNGSYGWLIEIDHGDDYSTLYSHNRNNFVAEGQTVVKGQVIAEIGSTGLSTGPHVHFEVRKNNRNINPIKYLYRDS